MLFQQLLYGIPIVVVWYCSKLVYGIVIVGIYYCNSWCMVFQQLGFGVPLVGVWCFNSWCLVFQYLVYGIAKVFGMINVLLALTLIFSLQNETLKSKSCGIESRCVTVNITIYITTNTAGNYKQNYQLAKKLTFPSVCPSA